MATSPRAPRIARALAGQRLDSGATARARISTEAAVLSSHGYRAVLRREVGGDPVVAEDEATDRRGDQPGSQAGGTIVITYDLA